MTTKKEFTPKTETLYVGYDLDYGCWELNISKSGLFSEGNIGFYFTVKVPKIGSPRRQPAYIGEFEVDLVDEAA